MSTGVGLALVVVAAIACLVAGLRAGRRTRPLTRRSAATTVGLIGTAALLAALFGSAMRHFGGRQVIGQGGSGYSCAPWWMEIDSKAGVTDGDYTGPAPACRQAAIDAVVPAVLESVGVSLIAAAAASVWLAVRSPGTRRGSSQPDHAPAHHDSPLVS